MIKPVFCISKNKGADPLQGNRADDQHLCFHYIDSTLSLSGRYNILSLYPYFVVVQPGLHWAWPETSKKVFLALRLTLRKMPMQFATILTAEK